MPSLTPRERLAGLINSIKLSHDVPSKLDFLHRLKDDLLQDDPVLLAQFLPQLLDLLSDSFSPVRKFVAEMVGETGIKQLEFLPEIVPALISVLNDESPPVSRQAIACGMDLFRSTFEKIAVQGLYSSELDDSLETSWAWMLKFKDRAYSIAIQPGCDGTKLLALKFVESVVLLYTPDPNGSSELPLQYFEGNSMEFNVSWLRGGHPVLSVGDLSNEASRSLGLLLDQLRFPTVKSLSSLTIIVLINSISTIAKRRPSFYGRILPVLLGVDSTSSIVKGVHVFGARHALKNAFLSCLESTHPGAAPWRDRLLLAVREMKDGRLAEQTLDLDFKINGAVEGKDDSPITNEEKPSVKAPEDIHSMKGRKRLESEDHGDQVSDDDISGKRIKHSPSISEESSNELNRRNVVSREEDESSEPPSGGENDSGPVQQLVAMFGALVAQGEKYAASLEILISSISVDLLAEVVMANMRHLPLERPKADESEALQDISLSRAFPQIASLIGAQQMVSDDSLKSEEAQDLHMVEACDDVTNAEKINDTEFSAWPTASAATSDVIIGTEKVASAEIHSADDIEGEIPGLSSSSHNDGPSETLGVSLFAVTDAKDDVPEEETNLTGKSQLESLPSVSNDRSEELSPKVIAGDGNIPFSSSATSAGVSAYFTLPKIAAPVVDLAGDQKDNLQRLAFSRIIEAYKEISLAGASQVRSSLLSHIGFELPSDLGPWKLLQQHILSDYANHEGHELVLRLLYRLYGEAEVERDFFHSTTASSEYETLLLNVAEALKDSFPPSDKSLSRLLVEVPSLPESLLKLLECLCSPGSSEKSDKELQIGDQVTQGLSTVWSLILMRPPIRNVCLNIALQSAVHHSEEVRMKAIRLIANKLYPLSYISQAIEDFAKDKLLSAIKGDSSGDGEPQDPVKERHLDGHLVGDASNKDISAEAPVSGTGESASLAISEVQRCMSLYFALCTKKHSLFRQIFLIYNGASKVAKQAIHRQLPILVRTMGASSELLAIISDAPVGSESLLMQVLQTLTDGIVPSPDLIHAIKKLYDSKVKDIEVLMPVLPFLQKEEVFAIFPNILNLPSDKFQAALVRILQGSSHAGLSPQEILIAIHGIDPERDRIPLKKVTDACNACFEQREIFTQQVLAKVLNQLVEQIPLPLLFMRTVLQAIGAFPALADFILEILSRLVSKQIWKYPKLWVGFLKCALLTKPQSFSVLLQLPPAQLENALNRTAALREPLTAHASQPNIRSSLPRSMLAVLGLADPETSSQVQTSQAHTGDTSTSDKEVVTGKESSAAS